MTRQITTSLLFDVRGGGLLDVRGDARGPSSARGSFEHGCLDSPDARGSFDRAPRGCNEPSASRGHQESRSGDVLLVVGQLAAISGAKAPINSKEARPSRSEGDDWDRHERTTLDRRRPSSSPTALVNNDGEADDDDTWMRLFDDGALERRANFERPAADRAAPPPQASPARIKVKVALPAAAALPAALPDDDSGGPARATWVPRAWVPPHASTVPHAPEPPQSAPPRASMPQPRFALRPASPLPTAPQISAALHAFVTKPSRPRVLTQPVAVSPAPTFPAQSTPVLSRLYTPQPRWQAPLSPRPTASQSSRPAQSPWPTQTEQTARQQTPEQASPRLSTPRRPAPHSARARPATATAPDPRRATHDTTFRDGDVEVIDAIFRVRAGSDDRDRPQQPPDRAVPDRPWRPLSCVERRPPAADAWDTEPSLAASRKGITASDKREFVSFAGPFFEPPPARGCARHVRLAEPPQRPAQPTAQGVAFRPGRVFARRRATSRDEETGDSAQWSKLPPRTTPRGFCPQPARLRGS
ncbi:hypothetical protein M885DRAFT_613897 [Pelagophyceae sp. CCMP2097]|nr:hypothetical protein M885DRAFT_613897 [Pelagophyceae sp. CCMP2097]